MSTTPAPTNNKKTRKSANLLAIIAIAIALFCVTLLVMNHQSVATLKQQWQSTLISSKTATGVLQQQLQQQQQRLTALDVDFTKAFATTTQSRHHIFLSQALYQLNLANMALVINHDITTAQHALYNAATYIKALPEGPTLATISKTIKQAISQLDLLSQRPDADERISSLRQLNLAIQQVPTLPNIRPPSPPQPKASSVHTASSWQEKVHQVWKGFTQMIVIRHHDASRTPMLSDQSQQLTKQAIAIQIDIAQWAVAQRNNPLYHNTLMHIHQAIQERLPQNKETTAVLATLNHLQAQHIAPTLPNLSPLITQLQAQLAPPTNLPPLSMPATDYKGD